MGSGLGSGLGSGGLGWGGISAVGLVLSGLSGNEGTVGFTGSGWIEGTVTEGVVSCVFWGAFPG